MKWLVTAGPTKEFIDPVRFITNRSSGKMGAAIANAAGRQGHDVVVVTSVSDLDLLENIKVINITSALDMHKEILREFNDCDVCVMAAAVADYRVESIAGSKIKKDKDELLLRLIKNPDIIRELGSIKHNRVLVGFAAETENVIENAKNKLKLKNLDMIIANDISKKDLGFEVDTNEIIILYKNGNIEGPIKQIKKDLGAIIVEKIDLMKNYE